MKNKIFKIYFWFYFADKNGLKTGNLNLKRKKFK
jgi:hypothetical protein